MMAMRRRARSAASVLVLVVALILAALASLALAASAFATTTTSATTSAAATTSTAAAASANARSACSARRGTIVAVDFAHWGGPIVRGCGLGAASGYALLHEAGFTTAGDQHDGPGFICRLGSRAFRSGGDYPTPAQQACLGTPSASAYWSYWLAPAGSRTWTYSTLGASTERPRPGEVQLWTFGSSGSGTPRVAPSALRAGASPRRIGGVAVLAALPGGAAGAIGAGGELGSGSAGSALPLVIGVCLVVVLCAGAAWALWRRRAYE